MHCNHHRRIACMLICHCSCVMRSVSRFVLYLWCSVGGTTLITSLVMAPRQTEGTHHRLTRPRMCAASQQGKRLLAWCPPVMACVAGGIILMDSWAMELRRLAPQLDPLTTSLTSPKLMLDIGMLACLTRPQLVTAGATTKMVALVTER
jgi:hypothetical protein